MSAAIFWVTLALSSPVVAVEDCGLGRRSRSGVGGGQFVGRNDAIAILVEAGNILGSAAAAQGRNTGHLKLLCEFIVKAAFHGRLQTG
jgi:hypothetical protein